LVFLGLLGTFWGLLSTIQAVGGTISALDTKVSDSVLIFEELKFEKDIYYNSYSWNLTRLKYQ
ncbi:MAG: hypothetical protein AAFY76_19525, partial [Cyanobacteria bacterium J06649_11]